MAKSHQDRFNDEINRRLSNAAAAAGIPRGRIELEVLFLLPPEFVRQYQELFRQALDDPVTRGDGGKDEGRVKAAGKPRDDMKVRSMGGAKSGGKRYVAGHWPIRSEAAMEAKRKLDKLLIREVDRALGSVRAARNGTETVQVHRNKCSECGRFLDFSWIRCPFHQ